jgi:riboflavin kinase/FMN adenylyltransferase
MITKITSEVIHGRKDGRKIGFATANLEVDLSSKNIKNLATGIYASKVKVKNKLYNSASYFGKAVTYNETKTLLEVHILDFDEDIYGEIIEVELIQFVRPVVKFNSLEELKIQIKIDCEKCLSILDSIKL